jgi:hypothetical protein
MFKDEAIFGSGGRNGLHHELFDDFLVGVSGNGATAVARFEHAANSEEGHHHNGNGSKPKQERDELGFETFARQ